MNEGSDKPRHHEPLALDIPERMAAPDDAADLQTWESWDPRRDVIHWHRSLFRITCERWAEVVRPVIPSALIAIPISFVANVDNIDHLYSRLLWAEAMIAATLLGFALVATSTLLNVIKGDFLNDIIDGSSILEGSGLYSVQRTVWPFWFLALLAVVTIVVALVGIALSYSLCYEARQVFIGITSLFSFSSVFSVVSLILYPWLYAIAGSEYH